MTRCDASRPAASTWEQGRSRWRLTVIGAKFGYANPDPVGADHVMQGARLGGSLSMTKIQIELPDSTAQAARDAGPLTPQALDRLLTDAIRRRQAADALLFVADRTAKAGIAPMPMDEIDAEVKAVRAERRRRAGGH